MKYFPQSYKLGFWHLVEPCCGLSFEGGKRFQMLAPHDSAKHVPEKTLGNLKVYLWYMLLDKAIEKR